MCPRRNMPVKNLIFLVACLAATGFYFLLVSSQYLAYYSAQKNTWSGLQFAVRVEPANAGYQYRTGQFLSLLQRYPEAAGAFTRATKLNPNSARYWLALASVENDPSLVQSQRIALQRAIAADPKNPRVLWEAGNTFLTQGDTNSAFRYLRSALEGDPSLSWQVIQICWQARPEVGVLLQQALPRDNPAVYSALLAFLISQRDTASAAKAWAQMMTLGQPVKRSDAFDYIRYLIAQHQPAEAGAVWKGAALVCDLRDYQPLPANLIVNGDFSLDVLNGGFDWVYEKRSGVSLQLDPTQPHMGPHSLLISYNSGGLDDSGIHQLIPLRGNTHYHFSAYFKTQNLQGAGGPRFLLRDFYSGKSYFESKEFDNARDWTQIDGEFETAQEPGLLVLQIAHTPAASAIRGKLWIDGVRLTPLPEQKVQ